VLRDLISPYLLRRRKADVATQLPKKTETVLFCTLRETQRDLYRYVPSHTAQAHLTHIWSALLAHGGLLLFVPVSVACVCEVCLLRRAVSETAELFHFLY
jgi:hypothetical protein